MKKLFSFVIVLALFSSLFASESISKHSVSIHAGGAASFFECEYQYKFVSHEKLSLSATAGINTLFISYGLPVGLNMTYGQKNQFLFGLRFMPDVLVASFDDEVTVPYWNYYANLRVGYGHEISLFDQTFTLYVYASPLFNLTRNSNFLWGGLALTGYL